MKDFEFFCNRIINEWILALILKSIQIVFYIFLTFGIVGGGIILLIICEYELLSISFYNPFFIILTLICIGVFIFLSQFEFRVLIDLKKFINTPNHAIHIVSNCSIKEVTSELEDLCRYIVKDTTRTIPELSKRVNKFKKIANKKKEDT